LLFFIFTNFCRPLINDTNQCVAEYKKLKTEVKKLEGVNEKTLTPIENKLKMSISQLEEHFPSKEKFKFVQQLSSSAEGLGITFTDIARKDSQTKEGYEEFPVEVLMKTSFNDFSRYLSAIEQSPVMIGISHLDLRKVQLQSPILDLKITFVGFNLLLAPTPITKYMEEKYEPINNNRLEALLEPLPTRDNQGVVSRLGLYGSFFTVEPMQAVKTPDATKSGIDSLFSLQGILHVQNEKAALINGIVVKEGEIIEGAQVVAIQDEKVILKYLGRDYIVTMGVGDAFTK